VHPRGAPHLIDPGKLLSSAQRIYGERMDVLWGELLPAAAERVVPVEDGATIEAGGLRFTAHATPGHAGHHHVFRLGDVVFCGDAAGIRLPRTEWIDLPAPPPEFDLELWRDSLARIRALGARTLYRTHFGAGDAPEDELTRFEGVLEHGASVVREMLDAGLERPQMVRRFSAAMRELAATAGSDPALLAAYELANPRVMSVDGIARYWRKRAEAG